MVEGGVQAIMFWRGGGGVDDGVVTSEVQAIAFFDWVQGGGAGGRLSQSFKFMLVAF